MGVRSALDEQDHDAGQSAHRGRDDDEFVDAGPVILAADVAFGVVGVHRPECRPSQDDEHPGGDRDADEHALRAVPAEGTDDESQDDATYDGHDDPRGCGLGDEQTSSRRHDSVVTPPGVVPPDLLAGSGTNVLVDELTTSTDHPLFACASVAQHLAQSVF